MDATPTAQTQDPAMLAKLAAMFGGKGESAPAPAGPEAMPSSAPAAASSGTAADTAKDSAAPSTMQEGQAQAAPSAASGKGGLMEALQSLMQFFQAKPASASNDDLYQKRLEEAGIPADETGVGK